MVEGEKWFGNKEEESDQGEGLGGPEILIRLFYSSKSPNVLMINLKCAFKIA